MRMVFSRSIMNKVSAANLQPSYSPVLEHHQADETET